MKIEVVRKGSIFRVRVNDPTPIVDFGFEGYKESSMNELPENLEIIEGKSDSPFIDQEVRDVSGIIIRKDLKIDEHIYGLGEKAFELDRKRQVLKTWNADVGAISTYKWYTDPMYISIPFFISVNSNDKKIIAYFINSASMIHFDFGVYQHNKINVFVPESSVEFFVFEGKTVEEVLELYTDITGRPFLIPDWGLGFQISRFSYYPQDNVIEVVKKNIEKGIRVSAVYLDIDYMDKYKIFTWDKEKFPDPKRLSEELHKLGVRLITIINPCLKVSQTYEPFKEALGLFVETEKGEIFTARMWPGTCAWIDFTNSKARNWWKNKIKEWVNNYGIDGIWLDMNEPTAFGPKYSTFDFNSIHHTDKGEATHLKVHNAYPYFQALATFEGLKEAGLEPFILSRAGYAGIQKYAVVWTADNWAVWDDLRLQTVLALGLSISGVPYVGCELDAFMGRTWKGMLYSTDPMLLTRYFQIALFFPFYRVHKAKDGIDTEPYNLPEYYFKKVKEAIDTRYKFLPYLSSLSLEAHEKGHPILRPLVYYYPFDDNVYRIDDEYFVGPYILYAPLLDKDNRRIVYLPEGKWVEFWTNSEFRGPTWIENESELPIYVKENSIIPLAVEKGLDLIIYGDNGYIRLRDGTEILYRDNEIRLNKPTLITTVEFRRKNVDKIKLKDGKEISVTYNIAGITRFNVNDYVTNITL